MLGYRRQGNTGDCICQNPWTRPEVESKGFMHCHRLLSLICLCFLRSFAITQLSTSLGIGVCACILTFVAVIHRFRFWEATGAEPAYVVTNPYPDAGVPSPG